MVPRVFIFLLLTLVASVATAQEVAVQLVSMNTVYVGVDNPLALACDNIARNKLAVSTSNGELSPGMFGLNYRPLHPGRAVIYISKIERGDSLLIDSCVFRAKMFLPPVAKIGSRSGGKMNAALFRVQVGPEAILDEFYHLLPITSFDILFIRDSEVVVERHHRNELGCLFRDDSETELLMSRVSAGDVVWLRNIVGTYGTHSLKLNDIILQLQ